MGVKNNLLIKPFYNVKGWGNVNFIDAKNYLEKGINKKPYLMPIFEDFCDALEEKFSFILDRNYFNYEKNNIIEFAIVHTLLSDVNKAYIEKMLYYLFKNKEVSNEDYWTQEQIREVIYFAYNFK